MGQYDDLISAAQQVEGTVREILLKYARMELAPTSTVAHRLNPTTDTEVTTVYDDSLRFTYDRVGDTITSVYYSNLSVQNPNDVIRHRSELKELPECLERFWEDKVGGDSIDTTTVEEALSHLDDQAELAKTAITVDGVIDALQNDHVAAVEQFFDVDMPLNHPVEHPESDLQNLVGEEIERVEYKDPDFALVLPEHETGGWAEDLYEGYVIGTDDTPTGLFVHPVAVEPTPIDRTVTREGIRWAMGFDTHYSGEEYLPEERGVRLQGDLVVDHMRSLNGDTDVIPSEEHRSVRNTVRWSRVQQYLNENGVERLRPIEDEEGNTLDPFSDLFTIRVDSGVTVNVSHHYFDTAMRVIREVLDIPDSLDHSKYDFNSDEEQEYGDALVQLLEAELQHQLQVNEEQINEEIDNQLENLYNEYRDPGQLNLTVDNHLTIFGNAYVHPDSSREEEPVEVVVPRETTIHVLHDEHEQVDVKLTPGHYRFRLMPRAEPGRNVRVTEK